MSRVHGVLLGEKMTDTKLQLRFYQQTYNRRTERATEHLVEKVKGASGVGVSSGQTGGHSGECGLAVSLTSAASSRRTAKWDRYVCGSPKSATGVLQMKCEHCQ
ncbi:hypothetical protein WMY93_029197 [Mugilogobius chulae]|uniref:Uncharacterized protein n=1 Tax=Mugilogobius chulae TaxID=88201 RepID=A0AAW0N2S2_9GOBI